MIRRTDTCSAMYPSEPKEGDHLNPKTLEVCPSYEVMSTLRGSLTGDRYEGNRHECGTCGAEFSPEQMREREQRAEIDRILSSPLLVTTGVPGCLAEVTTQGNRALVLQPDASGQSVIVWLDPPTDQHKAELLELIAPMRKALGLSSSWEPVSPREGST